MSRDDLLMVAAIALIFAPLERLWPAGRTDHSPRRLTTDVLHLLVGGWLIRWGAYGAALAVSAGVALVTPADLRAAVRGQPDWLEFAELFLLADLGFYAAHRLVHATPWLWRFHAVHHSSRRLDWLATYRVHPVDQVVNSTIIALPALLLGFSPVVLLLHAVLYRFHSVLLHSNLRLDFGPARWLAASPHYHHWHHADEPQAYDRNFGGQLVVFDWLFGTLHMPKGLPAAYGVTEVMPATFLGQLAQPFRARQPRVTPQIERSPDEPEDQLGRA